MQLFYLPSLEPPPAVQEGSLFGSTRYWYGEEAKREEFRTGPCETVLDDIPANEESARVADV